MKRRSFLALLGVSPVAAKAAVDAEAAKQVGVSSINGLGSGSVGLELPGGDNGEYQQRLIKACDYVQLFGVPDVVDQLFRDRSKYVQSLDPDIACKRSWSMSVKIMTQRQRNYAREIERTVKTGPYQRAQSALAKRLGFAWPW